MRNLKYIINVSNRIEARIEIIYYHIVPYRFFGSLSETPAGVFKLLFSLIDTKRFNFHFFIIL
jgi:hypothetical protein